MFLHGQCSPWRAPCSIALCKCTYKSTLRGMSLAWTGKHCLWMTNSHTRLFVWPLTFPVKPAQKKTLSWFSSLSAKILICFDDFFSRTKKSLWYIFISYPPYWMLAESLGFLLKFRDVWSFAFSIIENLEVYCKHITSKSRKSFVTKESILLKLNSANKMQEQSTSLMGLSVAFNFTQDALLSGFSTGLIKIGNVRKLWCYGVICLITSEYESHIWSVSITA